VSVANRFGLFGKTHYPYLEMVKCLHADCWVNVMSALVQVSTVV
jgi:hypothetical protein